jgi:hypothetical protein
MSRKDDPECWRKAKCAKNSGSDDVKIKKVSDFGQSNAPERLAETQSDGTESAPLKNLRVFMWDMCKMNIS